MKVVLNTFFALVMSSVAIAGGWVSSGGELFRDAKNPWFVRNTSVVKYCIQVEKTGFSADSSTIATAIKEGFNYWKNEFSRSPMPGRDGSFELGTQSFEQVACDQNPDIQFLFGYQTLSTEQITYLKDPKKFIGVTVRTDYDLKNLKAKGFVFFSSDQGPNAYDNNGSLIEKAWTRPVILKYAILHELGHIFGIPHMGSGLMSEVFLNQILNKNLVDMYEKSPVESFLQPSETVESCFVSPQAMNWFVAPSGMQCLLVQSTNVLGGNWKILAKKDKDSAPIEIGEIRGLMPNFMDQRGRPATILELNDQQTVYTPKETVFRSFMMGPLMLDMGISGNYFSAATKRPQPLYISITPSSLSIQSQVSPSKLEPVFIFNSPLSVLLMLSPKP